MHAERDYLVKRVFPELREWCEKRKLRLIDIDLRWGVTEADATSRNTVKICLTQIDKARPFFLCFLGQRRGWVPSRNEIDPETCTLFPDLKGYVGAASVTEMEILHAVVSPLNDSTRAEHAFFFHRDPSYLDKLPIDPPYLRNTYTNEGIEDPEARAKADADLRSWLEKTIPQTRRPLHHYTATWSPEQQTPELALPLQCPSSLPENQERWREQWREAGIEPRSLDLTEDPELERQARAFNDRVTTGRLTDFKCDEQDLAAVILQNLQSAIGARYPNRDVIPPETLLQKELDQQAQFLELNSIGFIDRTGDFDTLDQYIDSDSTDLFVLTAPAGMGKTMLLANWIQKCQILYGEDLPIFYRFIGASDGSTTVDAVLRSLLSEIKEAGYLTDDIPVDPQELRGKFENLLKSIGKTHTVLLVIDALNQLESGLSDHIWIPRGLPTGVKLVVSFKRDGDEAEQLVRHFRDVVPETCSEVTPFASLEDRKQLVNAYLEQYLKQLDDAHVQALITSPGADNPLFLKVVLSELRVFGSFGNLGQKIQTDFGTTPESAFDAVLRRLEADPAFTAIPFNKAVPLLFGLLSHARVGLTEQELVHLFNQDQCGPSEQLRQETIRLILRQVQPFCAIRDGRVDFFYDSFRSAALARYKCNGQQHGQRESVEWHRMLAVYFESLEPWVSRDPMVPTLRRAAELPYHLAWAGKADHLGGLLLGYDLLEAVVYGLGPYEAIGDIQYVRIPPVPVLMKLAEEDISALSLLQGALRLSARVLFNDPSQLPSQLYGRLLALDTRVDTVCSQIEEFTDHPWLRPCYRSLIPPATGAWDILPGHTEWVQAVAISDDGRRVISGSGDKTLRVWDLESGTSRILFGHAREVDAVAITPNGLQAVSGSADTTIRVWDLESGFSYHLFGHTDRIWGVAISANGQRVVSGSQDKTLRIWDIENGAVRVRNLIEHTNTITDVAITADGRRAISGAEDNTLRVWDLESGTLISTWDAHWISSVAILADGCRAVSGSWDKSLRVWDLESGSSRELTGHTDWVNAVAISADGRRAISGSTDKSVRVWDLESGTSRELTGHIDKVNTVAISADGRRAISGSWDKMIRVWDLESNTPYDRTKQIDKINAVAISADGRRAILGSTDKSMRIWDFETRTFRELTGHLYDGGEVAISADGRRAVSRSDNYTLLVWDLENGTFRELTGHPYNGGEVAISADGRRAVSWSGDSFGRNGEIIVWDLESGTSREIFRDKWAVNAIAISADGLRMASGSNDGTLRVWDLESGTSRELTGHPHDIREVVISTDGLRAVTGSSDGTLRVWDLESGTSHELIGHKWAIKSIAISADARHAVSGSWDILRHRGELRGWDLERGTSGELLGHKGGIPSVAISSNGLWAASGSLDRTLRIWNLETRSQVTVYSTDAGIKFCDIGTGGRIIVRDESGTVHLLQLKMGDIAQQTLQ